MRLHDDKYWPTSIKHVGLCHEVLLLAKVSTVPMTLKEKRLFEEDRKEEAELSMDQRRQKLNARKIKIHKLNIKIMRNRSVRLPKMAPVSLKRMERTIINLKDQIKSLQTNPGRVAQN